MSRPSPDRNPVLKAVMARARQLGFEPRFERGKKHPKVIVPTPGGAVTISVSETSGAGPVRIKLYERQLMNALARAGALAKADG